MQKVTKHRLTLVVILLIAACAGEKRDVPCTQDSDCDLTTGGVCVPSDTGANMWCAYPDETCSSGLRYSDQGVGDDLGRTCTEGTLYTLTVALGGSGEGGVTTTPGTLSCSGNTCSAKYLPGTVVQLAATPTMGEFLGWSDACSGKATCAVTLDRDQIVGALFGTPGAVRWAKQLGSSDRDVGHAVVIDNANDLIVVGEFSGMIAFGATTLTSAGGTDVYVAKISSVTGDVLWARGYGNTMNDVGLDVAVDAANAIYVTGRFLGSVDFGGGALQSGTQADAFALKLAGDGSFGWARKFGGNGFENGITIAARGAAVVVAGGFNSAFTIDVTPLPANGPSNIFVVSMTATTGASSWIKTFGASAASTTAVTDLAIDGAGNVVLTGFYSGTQNFGGGAMSTPGNFLDVLLLKLDGSSGAHLLSNHFGGGVHDYGYGVAVDAANNIYLIGDFGGPDAAFGCAETLDASQANLTDVYLVKYTQGGSCVWAKGFGGTGTFDRMGRGVSANAAGDVAIVGSFCGAATFGGPMLTAAGTCSALDVFAARFQGDGTHLNSVRVGGTGSEYGFGVVQDGAGFYATGSFQGFAEFGGNAFTSAGGDDIFVVGLEAL